MTEAFCHRQEGHGDFLKPFWFSDACPSRLNRCCLNSANNANSSCRQSKSCITFRGMPYANQADRRANSAKYRAENPDKIKKWYFDWKERHPGKEKEYNRKRYLRRREHEIAVAKRQYWKNPEAAKARSSAYRKKYPEKCRDWDAKRRARRRANGIGNFALIERWERKWKNLATVKCYWCRKPFKPKQCHSDHIIAIRNGGPHSIENMCISCSLCNSTKKAKSVSEWNQFLSEPVLF